MENVVFLVTVFLTLLVAAIPSFSEVIKSGPGGKIKGFTINGWITIALVVIAILLQCIQYQRNAQIREQKKAQYQRELEKKDSLNKSLLIQNNKELLGTVTSSLAQYHFRYDSAQKAIHTFSGGAAKNVKTAGRNKTPVIFISRILLDSFKNDKYYFSVVVSSPKSPACHVHLNLRAASWTGSAYSKPGEQVSYSEDRITGNRRYALSLYKTAAQTAFYAFYFHGNYADCKGRTIPFKKVYGYSTSKGLLNKPVEEQAALSLFEGKP
jgi:hypothetical protein